MTLHKSQGMIAFKLNLVSGEGGGVGEGEEEEKRN